MKPQLSGFRDCDEVPLGDAYSAAKGGSFESCHQRTSVGCLGLGWADLLNVGRGFG